MVWDKNLTEKEIRIKELEHFLEDCPDEDRAALELELTTLKEEKE